MSNIFETMVTCLTDKELPEDKINEISSYLFCKWLSGSPYTVLASNTINRYYDIPVYNQYKMIQSAFKGKVKYIKYPKNISAISEKDVELVSKHFKVRLELAKQYLKQMSEDELKHIRSIYQ